VPRARARPPARQRLLRCCATAHFPPLSTPIPPELSALTAQNRSNRQPPARFGRGRSKHSSPLHPAPNEAGITPGKGAVPASVFLAEPSYSRGAANGAGLAPTTTRTRLFGRRDLRQSEGEGVQPLHAGCGCEVKGPRPDSRGRLPQGGSHRGRVHLGHKEQAGGRTVQVVEAGGRDLRNRPSAMAALWTTAQPRTRRRHPGARLTSLPLRSRFVRACSASRPYGTLSLAT